jgi:hypothetical protein
MFGVLITIGIMAGMPNPLYWKPGDPLPHADFKAKLRMTPMEQLNTCVEDYFRNNIRAFRVPTPFATIEDFYCVVYSPGMSGKPDSYNATWLGKVYNKGKQMDIYRSQHLKNYDYPKKESDTSEDMPDFMKWTPGRRRVQTTAIGVNVRSGPGTRFPVVRTLMAVGARFALLDVVTGESVNGNTDWFKVGPNEFISGTVMAMAD